MTTYCRRFVSCLLNNAVNPAIDRSFNKVFYCNKRLCINSRCNKWDYL